MTKTVTLRIPLKDAKVFQTSQPVKVDIEKLKASGELDAVQLHVLANGYPGAPILFMDFTDSGFAIGIKTGAKVYPKNIFWITPQLALEAVDPIES